MAQYIVWVTTGDDEHAGTDSNVFIRLAGTQGVSETLHLPAQDVFAFEAGSVDKFVLDVPDLGDLRECCIGHDNSDGGWYVKTVQIQHEATGSQWGFVFEQWLDEAGELSTCVVV